MKRIAIVVATFYEDFADKLLQGALEEFGQANIKIDSKDIVEVPGAFELPIVAQALAKTKKYDGILCLGLVIRGETAHFDYVCQGATQGIMEVSLIYNLPISFGVLTTENAQQAHDRCGGKKGNKGADCAKA